MSTSLAALENQLPKLVTIGCPCQFNGQNSQNITQLSENGKIGGKIRVYDSLKSV